MLVIQNYDHIKPGRLWFLAFFILCALLLLGRLHFLQNKKSWRERRVFLSPDNSLELTSSMAIAAALLIVVSWSIPVSLSSWEYAVNTWEKVTKPWRDFANDMENAVSALDAPGGSKRGEFFGSQLPLGRGFPLSDAIMFQVQAPELSIDQRPPRYYWRGRTYDTFFNGQWYSTGTDRREYSPDVVNPFRVHTEERTQAHYVITTGDETFSLLYSPAQPIWVSRAGITFTQPAEDGGDIVAWHAFPWLKSGETYQVDALLNNPNLEQLQQSGSNYPQWVLNKYVQLPDNFSPQIRQLAHDITASAETPFDKATAITDYLRTNIEYVSTVPQPPRNADTLEWILFDYRKGFCVYYASSEVVMLRSLGIPARMAVGFAEGEREGDTYTVRKLHAHAWPEVYFPNIGWVEFEPTGNQPELDRPLPPSDQVGGASTNPFGSIIPEDSTLGGREPTEPDLLPPTPVAEPPSPLFYIIPAVLAVAILMYFANRRFSLATRVPVVMRATLERTGFDVPKWVLHWESWGHLSQIERAFESINFGLRTLDHALPVHNTPMERALRLTTILPQMSDQIKVLLDEHQTSLYTSRVPNILPARQAAFEIRKQVLLERIRYLLYGKRTHE
jgi:transglutaminase-like putative cysteine protease